MRTKNIYNYFCLLLCVIVACFCCVGCGSLTPEPNVPESRFSFLKNQTSFTKFDLYIDEGTEASFSMPVFANKYLEKTSETFPIEFVSASGENLSDVDICVNLDWLSCDSNFNSIYVFCVTVTANDFWDHNVLTRKIDALRFSYNDIVADFNVDVKLYSDFSTKSLLESLSIARNNTKYSIKSETETNGHSTFDYQMTLYCDCTGWGASDIFDETNAAYVKSVYFEHSHFDINNYVFHYHPIDSLNLEDFSFANLKDISYELSKRIDTVSFGVTKNDELNDYLFIGDNLIFEIEYSGKTYNVLVANIQMNGRNSALEKIFVE